MANLNDGYEGPPAGSQVLLQSNCLGASLETYNVSCSFAAIRRMSARFEFMSAIVCSFKRSFFWKSIPLHEHITVCLSTFPLDWQVFFPSTFWPLWIRILRIHFIHFFFFVNLLITSIYISLGKYLGMPLLSQRDCICLNIRNFQILFQMICSFLPLSLLTMYRRCFPTLVACFRTSSSPSLFLFSFPFLTSPDNETLYITLCFPFTLSMWLVIFN